MAYSIFEWQKALCEAFGLDPAHVNRIDLSLDAANPAVLTVRLYPDKSDKVKALLQEAGKQVDIVRLVEDEREIQISNALRL